MSESVILCEGFYDRAFWAGWLEYLGCPKPKNLGNVFDPVGRQVKGGHFGYSAKSGRFVRIVPCQGKPKIFPEARRRIEGRHIAPKLSHLVICVDLDTSANKPSAATGLRVEDVRRVIREIEPHARDNDDGDIELDAGAMVVSLVRWETEETHAEGIPALQSLERLVCAALVAAYPDRGPAVQDWLDGRPEAPDSIPKEFAWSHMAGWYADLGCDAFYRTVWEDANVAQELESRLRSSGAWRIAEALLG